MARTSNVFARVEPELKAQAEIVLNQLGLPMSNAIGIFLKQVVLQRGLPFEVKIPPPAPLAYASLTIEQFNTEIEKGVADYQEGRIQNAHIAFGELEQEFGL